MKTITDNKIPEDLESPVLRTEKGGTGADTINGAIVNLKLIPSSKRGASNGVASLDNNLLALDVELPEIPPVGNQIVLTGPSVVSTESITEYSIVGYSNLKHYEVSVDKGTVVLANDKVIYISTNDEGTVTITVNGINYSIIVVSAGEVDKPEIVSPVGGSFNVSINPVFTSTPFDYTGTSDTHNSSDWQIATDSNFTNIVDYASDNETHKTTWNTSNLDYSTTYYVRVRHNGLFLGYSLWSDTLTFTTAESSSLKLEEAVVIASDGTSNDYLGYSVSIDNTGSRIIVGSPGYNAGRGQAYIFTRDGTSWTEEAILLTVAGNSGDNYGMAVAISGTGDRVIIGAPGVNVSQGQAYIYVRTGTSWTEEDVLASDNETAEHNFGTSVHIDNAGSRVIVGADRIDNDQGLVYVYSRISTLWTQEAELSPSDGNIGYQFGYSVFINAGAGRAIVGAPGVNDFQGKAYVYSRSGNVWTEEAILIASDNAVDHLFGFSVAMDGSGNRALVGAAGANDSQGHVYVYSRDNTTWTQETILTASDGASGHNYGYSIDIDDTGGRIIVGSPGVNGFQGQVYMYDRNGTTWTEVAVLDASDGAGGYQFGLYISMDLNGDRIAIGAPGVSINQGAAYIFA